MRSSAVGNVGRDFSPAAPLASLAVHALLLLLVIVLTRVAPAKHAETVPDRLPQDLVWLIQPGPGGGGGGGGNQMPEPPKPVERAGTQTFTVPVAPASVP